MGLKTRKIYENMKRIHLLSSTGGLETSYINVCADTVC